MIVWAAMCASLHVMIIWWYHHVYQTSGSSEVPTIPTHLFSQMLSEFGDAKILLGIYLFLYL